MTDLAAAVRNADRRSIARLISSAERGDPAIIPTLGLLYRAGGKARIIGITGPPSAGKSTLIDQIVTELRALGQRVAVLAVDPTSPFSGGAVLGDRVRMARHQDDPDVFIRSMAARGALGGLADATGDALIILDAAAFDAVLVETVGVGQSEVDILAHADLVILLQTAEAGDGVQMVKAGVLEIADIVVLNKAELPGADRMAQRLADMLAHRQPTAAGWSTPVIKTQASAGNGVGDVLAAVDRFYSCRNANPADERRRRTRQVCARALSVAQAALRRTLTTTRSDPALEAAIAAVASRAADPSSIARLLLSRRVADA